jgi:glycosyltransferase involved in cell wall biosynthesis
MRVSVIMAVWNGAATLEKALASLRDQTYADVELIVVDDASTDATARLLAQWQTDNPQQSLTIIRQATNQGLTRSLQTALQQSQSEFIARLDADDWWHPTKLAQQIAFLDTHPNYGIVGCWYANVRPHSVAPVRLPVTDGDIRQSIFWRNPFGHSCVVMRNDLLGKVGGYNTNLRYGQDRDLWFRLLPHTMFANLPHVLCHRTVNAASAAKTRPQIRQQLKTVHTYAQLYRASPLVYLSFVEPILVYALPYQVRSLIRTIYDRLFTH